MGRRARISTCAESSLKIDQAFESVLLVKRQVVLQSAPWYSVLLLE